MCRHHVKNVGERWRGILVPHPGDSCLQLHRRRSEGQHFLVMDAPRTGRIGGGEELEEHEVIPIEQADQ